MAVRNLGTRGACRALVALALLAMSGQAGAAATSAPVSPSSTMLAPVIAIVDVQRILQESLAAKSVQQQLEAQRAKFQTEIVAEEKDLRQAEQELSKSRDNLKPDVFAEREQQLRQRFLTVERHVQSRRKALDQAYTNSMNVVRKSLQDVVGAVAKEYGANLVIIKQQTLWSDKQMDITDKALARLNNDLSRVEVKVLPEEEAKTGEKKAAPPR